MGGLIQRELKQSRPVGTLEEEAYLNVLRTAEVLAHAVVEVLKPYELTPTQYNVLRILRGAGERGLTAGDVGARMITRDSDVTRLLDRLERRCLVERWRCGEDRRVVWTRIAPEGVAAIEPLDGALEALHERQLGHLGEERLRALVELLEATRAGTST